MKKAVFVNESLWNRNGKLFIEIAEDNYETCGITTEIIDGDGTVRDETIEKIVCLLHHSIV